MWICSSMLTLFVACSLILIFLSEYDLGMGKQRDGPGSDLSDLTHMFYLLGRELLAFVYVEKNIFMLGYACLLVSVSVSI